MRIPINHKHQENGGKLATVFLRSTEEASGNSPQAPAEDIAKQLIEIVNAREKLGVTFATYAVETAKHGVATRRRFRALLRQAQTFGITALVTTSPQVLAPNWAERKLLQAELWLRGFDLITVTP